MFDASNLARFQNDFIATVTGERPDDAGLRIHHDTWFFGLIDSLIIIYPATHGLVGDDAFKAFARDHVRAHPLTSGDRNSYGGGFGAFLAAHPHLPFDWLPDLARHEYAIHEAQHAPDAEAAGFEALLDPAARVALHPSVRVTCFSHDIKPVYAAVLAGEPAPRVRTIACDALVGRAPDDDLVHICLAPLEVAFIAAIALEGSLAAALDTLDPSPDDLTLLQLLLSRLVQSGLLITL